MRPQYNVLIIGAGNIGALFDKPHSNEILTHAHAYWKHKGYNLLGFIDTKKNKAQKAVSIWGGKAYFSIQQAFREEKIDVVSVAVPDKYHFEVLKELSQFPVKLVFTEKPLTKTLQEADRIFKLYNKKNIPVAVNYSRRFVPEFQKISSDIKKGFYGAYLTGTGYYGKGIIHNGSHIIDILRFFNREVKRVKSISSKSDFYKDDKSVSSILFFDDNTQFFLQYADGRLYTLFEIDLLFEKKRIRIINSGFKIEEYKIKQDKVFKGYRNLIKTNEINTSLGNSLYYAADNIYEYLTKEEKLKCDLEDGYKALETCIQIEKKH